MAESKASVTKVGSAESGEVAAAEVETAPVQGGGEAPEKQTIPTGAGGEEDSVSESDKKSELQEEARNRGLDDKGTKQELVDRISEYDDKGVHKPEVLYAQEKK